MNIESGKPRIRPLLEQLVESTDALGAIAWNCTTLPYQEIDFYSPSEEGPLQLDCSPNEHLELIQSVADSGQPKIAISAKNRSSNDQPDSAAPPVLALMPVDANGSGKLILETFLKPNQDAEVYQSNLATMAGILSDSFSHEPDLARSNPSRGLPSGSTSPHPSQNEPSAANVAQYCDLIHRSIQKKESAARIANETRRLLDCDRVSVVRFAGNQSKIVAISGQQSVNRRSNTVRLLEHLAKRVLPLREEFVYPNEEETIAPQVETALDAYLKSAVVRCICIIPLYEKPEEEIAGASEQPKEAKLIGGLVIEHFTEEWELAGAMPLIRLAADHASNAYANSLRHESLWLYPLWNLLGKSKFLTATRRLPIFLSIVISVLLLTISLIVIPWEFKVVSDGYLIPDSMEYVYAPFDGEVMEIVDGGTTLPMTDNPIAGGNPNSVAKLLNLDLNERISRVEGQLKEAKNEYLQYFRIIEMGEETNASLRSEGQIKAQIESLEKRLEILKSQSDKLIIDSTIAGTVLTHSTVERLKNRPFKRGDKLLEIANTEGKWIVELKMPDNRIGHVLNAQQELRDDLKVTCVLATDPSKSFTGTVLEVAKSTEVSQESGQTVTIKVEIDPDTDPSFLHARSEVVGKVHCGRRSLGYVWFHQVGEFLNKNVWFRIW